jgi:hypothetical protein
VTAPTTFNLSATYDAESESAGGTFRVVAGPRKFDGTVQAGKELAQRLGEVRLEPGVHEIRVEPAQIAGAELMRLRNLTLTAVRHETSSR